ncbi:MAG: hypothetical protein Q4G03_05210 [Planctomycetia bacterium]|nr:hypothetical protein [Planctomycetia bacterium]
MTLYFDTILNTVYNADALCSLWILILPTVLIATAFLSGENSEDNSDDDSDSNDRGSKNESHEQGEWSVESELSDCAFPDEVADLQEQGSLEEILMRCKDDIGSSEATALDVGEMDPSNPNEEVSQRLRQQGDWLCDAVAQRLDRRTQIDSTSNRTDEPHMWTVVAQKMTKWACQALGISYTKGALDDDGSSDVCDAPHYDDEPEVEDKASFDYEQDDDLNEDEEEELLNGDEEENERRLLREYVVSSYTDSGDGDCDVYEYDDDGNRVESHQFKSFKLALIASFSSLLYHNEAVEQNLERLAQRGYEDRLQNYLFLVRFYMRSAWLCEHDAYDLGVTYLKRSGAILRAMTEEFNDCFDELGNRDLLLNVQISLADYANFHDDDVSCLNFSENAVERARKLYEDFPENKTARVMYMRALRVYCFALLQTQRNEQLTSVLNEYRAFLYNMTVERDGLTLIVDAASVVAHMYNQTGDFDSAIEVCHYVYKLIEDERARHSTCKRFFMQSYYVFIRTYCFALQSAGRVDEALGYADSTFDVMARNFTVKELASNVTGMKRVYELKADAYLRAGRLQEVEDTHRDIKAQLKHIFQTFPGANKSYTLVSTLISYCLNDLEIKFALKSEYDYAVTLCEAIEYVRELKLTTSEPESFLWFATLLNYYFDWCLQFDITFPVLRIQNLIARCYEHIEPSGDEEYEHIVELILALDYRRVGFRCETLSKLGFNPLSELVLDSSVRLCENLARDGRLDYTRALVGAHVIRANYLLFETQDGIQKAEKDLQIAWSLCEDISDVESQSDEDLSVKVRVVLLRATCMIVQERFEEAFSCFKTAFSVAKKLTRRYDYAGRDLFYDLFNCLTDLLRTKDLLWRWQWCAMVLRYLERYLVSVLLDKVDNKLTEEQFKRVVNYVSRAVMVVKAFRVGLKSLNQSELKGLPAYKLEKICHFKRFVDVSTLARYKPNALSVPSTPDDFVQWSELIKRRRQECQDLCERMRLVDLADLCLFATTKDLFDACFSDLPYYSAELAVFLYRLGDIDAARKLLFYIADLATHILSQYREDLNIAYETFELSTPQARRDAVDKLALLDSQFNPDAAADTPDSDAALKPEVVVAAFDLLENQTNALLVDCDLREDLEYCALTPGATPRLDLANGRFGHDVSNDFYKGTSFAYSYLDKLFLQGETLPQPRLIPEPSEELQTLRTRVELSFRLRILMLKRAKCFWDCQELMPLYGRAVSQFAEWLCSQGRVVEANKLVEELTELLKPNLAISSASSLATMLELWSARYVINRSFPEHDDSQSALNTLMTINSVAGESLHLLDLTVMGGEVGREVWFLYEFAARANLELYRLSDKDEDSEAYFLDAYRYGMAAANLFDRKVCLSDLAQIFADAFKDPKKPMLHFPRLSQAYEPFLTTFLGAYNGIVHVHDAEINNYLGLLTLAIVRGSSYYGLTRSNLRWAIRRIKTLPYVYQDDVALHCGDYFEEMPNAFFDNVGLWDLYGMGELRQLVVNYMRRVIDSFPRPDDPEQDDKYANTRQEMRLSADFYDLVNACENLSDEEIYLAVDRYKQTVAQACDFDPTPLFHAYIDALGQDVEKGLTGRVRTWFRRLRLKARIAKDPTLKELDEKWSALSVRVQNYVLIAQFLPILTVGLERKLRSDSTDVIMIPKTSSNPEDAQALLFRSSFTGDLSLELNDCYERLVRLWNVAPCLTTVDIILPRACNLAATKTLRDFDRYYAGKTFHNDSQSGTSLHRFAFDLSQKVSAFYESSPQSFELMQKDPQASRKILGDAFQNESFVATYASEYLGDSLPPQVFTLRRRVLEEAIRQNCFFLRPHYINMATLELKAQLKQCLGSHNVTEEALNSFVSGLARLCEMTRKLVARGISAKILISDDAVREELENLIQQVRTLCAELHSVDNQREGHDASA